MAGRLLDRLREKDKKGLFKPAQVSVMYPTGFLPFDYRNGYVVNVFDGENNVVDKYPSIGIGGGTFCTVVGKSGVAKTTWVIQTAYNIVKKFNEDAFVMIYDIEQSLNYTRIKNITKANQSELDTKIILRQEKNYIEDMFDSIVAIANDKEANKDTLMYDTGLCDELNRPIKTYIPTVIVIDSLPMLASKNDDLEMKGQTSQARMAQQIKQFYTKLMPIIKTYNITIFVINHINAKIEINPFAKTQSQLMYLGGDKSIPGGNAPLYLAHNTLEFISSTKFKMEDDGFDGFMVRVNLVKSRSNKAGQSVNLVYNQLYGFDPILSLYQFADDNNMLDGRNPYKYFKNNKEVKFDSRKFRDAFNNNEAVREALKEATQPLLEELLSDVNPENEEQ